MNIRSTSTARSQRLRARRSRGIAMVAPVEGGKSVQSGAVVDGTVSEKPTTLREAFALAKKQVGT